MALAPASIAEAKAPAKKTATKPVVATEYTVQSGDYLSKIAEKYNTTWQKLYDKNTNIQNPHLIHVGDKITIPQPTENITPRTFTEAPVAPVDVPEPVAPIQDTTPAPMAPVEVIAAPAPVVVSGCGDNSMANYIYMHESGCNTGATNAGGCYGIGQDCNGAVRTECGADYACQNAFFTRYANARYGGWDGAYAFWLANSWW